MALQRRNQAEEMKADAAEAEATQAELLDPEPETAPAPTRSAAVTTRVSTAPAPQQASDGRAVAMTALSDMGFGGLRIDWTSFPTIVLNQGEFELSDGNPLKVGEFTVRLQQTRLRYVYRSNTEKEDDAEVAYTYDPAELDDPSSELAQKLHAWREDGLTWNLKEYIEAVALVEDANLGDLDGQLVLLQIPPTSTARLSGYIMGNLTTKRMAPPDYLTRCSRGDKVLKVRNPFYPWSFRLVG